MYLRMFSVASFLLYHLKTDVNIYRQKMVPSSLQVAKVAALPLRTTFPPRPVRQQLRNRVVRRKILVSG